MMPDGRTYILPASGAVTHESPPHAAPAPASAGDLHEKAEALLRDGDEEGARVALEQALAADPTSAVVCNDLGVLLVRHQEAERALELHERAVKQAPDNAVFQKNLADLYFVVFGRTDEAVDIYVRLLDRNPQDVEVLCALGQISATLGREKEATIFLSRAVHFDPGNELARDLLREVTSPAAPSSPVASPPSSRERYETAGRLAFQGDRKGAIAQLESLIADEPGNALAHNDLGVLYSQEEDFQRALAHHERAAGLEPGNLTFGKNLAEMYLVGFGRVDDAIITYTDLLRRFPEDVEVLLGLAQISLSLNRLEETRSFCERVISLDPANDAAGQILALLHSAGSEPVEADSDIRRLEQLVESDPGNAAALNDLGVHYWQQGDAARSCACYERAVRLEPGNVTFRKNLADLYAVAFGRIDDAVVLLVEIITANPDDAEAIFTLGQLCIATGRTDDARTMIGRVVQLDPSHPYAPLLLKELQDPDFFLAHRQ